MYWQNRLLQAKVIEFEAKFQHSISRKSLESSHTKQLFADHDYLKPTATFAKKVAKVPPRCLSRQRDDSNCTLNLESTLKIHLGTMLFAVTITTVIIAICTYRYYGFSQQLDQAKTKMSRGDDGDAYRIQVYGNDIRPAVLVLIRHQLDTSISSEFSTIDFAPSTPTTTPRLVINGTKVSLTNGITIAYLSSTGTAKTIKLKNKHESEIIDDFQTMQDSNQPSTSEFAKKWYFQQAEKP